MSDFELDSATGETLSVSGQITKPVQAGDPPPWPNFPTSAAGYGVKFVAKRKGSDAQLIQLDAALSNGGGWILQIPVSATSTFTRTEDLLCEVWLTEPGGAQERVATGRWTVQKAVGPPA